MKEYMHTNMNDILYECKNCQTNVINYKFNLVTVDAEQQKTAPFIKTSKWRELLDISVYIYRPLGYERVYLPLYKVANTPFHIHILMKRKFGKPWGHITMNPNLDSISTFSHFHKKSWD